MSSILLLMNGYFQDPFENLCKWVLVLLQWVGRVRWALPLDEHTAIFVLVFASQISLNLALKVDCILDLITLY